MRRLDAVKSMREIHAFRAEKVTVQPASVTFLALSGSR